MSDGSLTFRQRTISRPLLGFVKRVLPRMSDTEREALEAGTVNWDAELFSGKPDWDVLLGMGPATLTPEEQAFMDGPVEQLCGMLDDWEINHVRHRLPDEVWDFIREQGFLGMIIPKSYGGLGFSASAHSAVVTKVSSCSIAAAVTIMVPNSLGPGELLIEYGTEDQKNHYLPRLADGRELPCFGLTSLDAGSDAAAMTDKGVVCYATHNGKKTLGMRVSWAKRYITLGPVASLLGLAFKLYDPDGLLGDKQDIGITVALVPTDTPGVEIGRRHLPVGQFFQNGPNSGKDVFIPMDWVIGGRDRVGQGWKMLVSALAAGRGISLPSLSASGAKLAAHATGAYARIREQFGIPIGKFEGVQEALARIAAHAYVLDAARRATTRMIDRGEKPAVLSGILKYHATERLRLTIDDAMDIHGGKGICDGPRNYLGNIYKAVPVAITVEGANILTRSLIIYGQGAVRCHPFLLKEMAAAQDDDADKGLRDFDAALFGHISFQLKTLARSLGHALTGGLLARSPVSGRAARHFRAFGRYAAGFALVSEIALISIGGALKRKEMLSGRLGDVLSELYLISCVLKRFEEDGRPPADLPLLDWACRTSFHAIQTRLGEVIDNFPNRPLAWFMTAMVFPLGRRRRPPRDRLTQACAELLLEPSDTRRRLVDGIYLGDQTKLLGQLDIAFEKTCALRHAGRKMRKAGIHDTGEAVKQQVITKSEAERLDETRALVREILAVDDFSQTELTGEAVSHDPVGRARRAAKAARAARPARPARPAKGDKPSTKAKATRGKAKSRKPGRKAAKKPAPSIS
jgi:acyl-CoA dehydrogenase